MTTLKLFIIFLNVSLFNIIYCFETFKFGCILYQKQSYPTLNVLNGHPLRFLVYFPSPSINNLGTPLEYLISVNNIKYLSQIRYYESLSEYFQNDLSMIPDELLLEIDFQNIELSISTIQITFIKAQITGCFEKILCQVIKLTSDQFKIPLETYEILSLCFDDQSTKFRFVMRPVGNDSHIDEYGIPPL